MSNESRSPEEIERKIERERAGLTSTLDDLQNKFSVETIARQFSDQFREHGGDIGRSVSEAVKRNPLALALTGVGLAWLMMGDKSNGHHYDDDERSQFSRRSATIPDSPRDSTRRSQQGGPSTNSYSNRSADDDDIPSWARTNERVHKDSEGRVGQAASHFSDNVSDAASAFADKAKTATRTLSDAGQSATDSAKSMASDISDKAADLRERLAEGTENLTNEARDRVIAARQSALEARDAAMSYTRHGRDRAVNIFEEQPLIAGALAIALGSALAASLPRSRTEDQYLGDKSDHLLGEAERIFNEEKQKLTKVAKAAMDESKDIVRQTKDEADSAAPANSAAQAIVDKAKESGQRIVDAAETEAKKQNLGNINKA